MQWEKDKEQKNKIQLDTLRPALQKIVTENFNILGWSEDETKVLYEASQSATLPVIIKPPIIGTNSTPEVRQIEKDSVYVYDIKEDKNYLINKGDKKIHVDYELVWFPDSKHLLYIYDHKIDIMEYDRQNITTVYAGPFEHEFVYPWPDGSKIVILTNLSNPYIPSHLYTVSLK